jgi:hypothetical protein
MHDPKTVAFEIKNPFIKDKSGYRPSIVTIWHNDPETDGTDDSCGWFIRARHVDQQMLEKVKKEFLFQFKHNYWFKEDGTPIFSTIGTAVQMYHQASWIMFMHMNNDKPDRKKHQQFMRKHLYDIIQFAENPVDCIGDDIIMKWGKSERTPEERANSFAATVCTGIMREIRPWYKHPRWHVHHWSIQFHPWQQLKRRYWDKCCVCGKRGFTGSAYADWGGGNLRHEHCEMNSKPQIISEL